MTTLQLIWIVTCFVVPIVAAVTAQGLLALWAATSRVHWFVRALAVWCGVMLLVPIRAYEPAAIFALSGLFILAILLVARWRWQRPSNDHDELNEVQRGPTDLRYGLRDLFLVTVLVALVLFAWRTIDQGYDRHDWVAFLFTAFSLSITVLLAYEVVVARHRWLFAAALMAFVVAAPFIVAPMVARTKAALFWHAAGTLGGGPYTPAGLRVIGTLHAAIGVLCILSLASAYGAVKQSTVRRNIARAGLALLTVAFGLPLVWLFWHMLWLTQFPSPLAHGPNEYARLVAISDALGGNRGKGPAPNANPPALLQEAESLLERSHFVVWDERASTKSGLDEHHGAASAMRYLSRLFDADARAMIATNQFDRAAELAIAQIRLGAAMNRGGDDVDAFIGQSCMSMGAVRMIEMRESLSPDACSDAISKLQQSLAELESIESIRARGAAYAERANGWSNRYENVRTKLAFGKDMDLEMLRALSVQQVTLMSLLETDLAIRVFQARHQRLPANLDELVPSCLRAVPIDPYSGLPLCYSAENRKFVLYSVGSDARDDGGRFFPKRSSRPVAGYDFDLDTLTRP